MTSTRKTLTLATLAVSITGLAACSGSGTSPQTVKNVANVSSNALQLSVGTANIFGDDAGAAVTGLNVAATYRQTSGNPGASGTLVNGPTLSGPFTLPAAAGTADGFNATIATGPGPKEVKTSKMGSTSQTGTGASTFGTAGGVFSVGIEPFNYTNFGVPSTDVPYAVPLYDTAAASSAGDPNSFIPFGGTPAFDPSGNAANAAGAIEEGLDVFEITPVAGSYNLSVAVPGNNGTITQSTSANLGSTALLPAITPATAVVAADGSAEFTVTLPAGVTEAYIQVVNFGPTVAGNASCVGASAGAPIYHTFAVVSSGVNSLPAGSICTLAQNQTANGNTTSDGDAFSVQTIGFDYPAFEASVPNSQKNPRPTLTGANGQSDITISSQAFYTQLPAGGGSAKLVPKAERVHVLQSLRAHRAR